MLCRLTVISAKEIRTSSDEDDLARKVRQLLLRVPVKRHDGLVAGICGLKLKEMLRSVSQKLGDGSETLNSVELGVWLWPWRSGIPQGGL